VRLEGLGQLKKIHIKHNSVWLDSRSFHIITLATEFLKGKAIRVTGREDS
jgi:hypothetical protein